MVKSRISGLLIALSAILWMLDGHNCLGFVPRTGFVTLQYDASNDYDYGRIFPRLEQSGLKGSFACVTEVSDLGIWHDPWKIQEIYRAGHEVQDHTTRHNYMWATQVDTLDDGITEWIPSPLASVQQWDSLCHKSTDILRLLGIRVTGWNQPGGGCSPGEIPGHPQWSSKNDTSYVLYDLIAGHYSYMLGLGVALNTAHVNPHSENCPDHFPVFNVPHVAIDSMDFEDVKTGIADAVASGLWYVAISHCYSLENVCRAESLIDWLAGTDIEVLTCREGAQRIQWGYPDPSLNQFPQASMTDDLDGNGKPDGFEGDCAVDTVSAPPIQGVACCEVDGTAEFYCYGPFLGSNAFSLWVKSASASPCIAHVAYDRRSFDCATLGGAWTTVVCPTEWTRLDTLYSANFWIDVEDEVDHLKFAVMTTGEPVLIACPELMHPYDTAASPEDHDASAGPSGLVVSPNPVRTGGALRVRAGGSTARIAVYDVLGRCLAVGTPRPGESEVTFDTAAFAPGVLFIRDASAPSRRAKVVVCR